MLVEKIKTSNITEFKDHEQVYHFKDDSVNLEGYVGIHSTFLGPATGGTRFWSYNDPLDALKDALQLSEAMSYKCAMSGVKFGGGKAVILAKGKKNKNLLKSYAEFIDTLQGIFTTGPDVGIDEVDTEYMSNFSPFILGHKATQHERLGTSEMAARGVYISIQKIIQVFGNNDLKGIKVAVKGLGKVGGELVRLLIDSGAIVYGSDIDIARCKYIANLYPQLKIVDSAEIASLAVDIYSPCAIGHEFTEQNVRNVKANFIIGAANNQLTTTKVGDYFYEHDKLYAPDYIVNAGGLINITDELDEGGYTPERVLKRIDFIGDTLLNVINISKINQVATYKVADELARKKISRSV